MTGHDWVTRDGVRLRSGDRVYDPRDGSLWEFSIKTGNGSLYRLVPGKSGWWIDTAPREVAIMRLSRRYDPRVLSRRWIPDPKPFVDDGVWRDARGTALKDRDVLYEPVAPSWLYLLVMIPGTDEARLYNQEGGQHGRVYDRQILAAAGYVKTYRRWPLARLTPPPGI